MFPFPFIQFHRQCVIISVALSARDLQRITPVQHLVECDAQIISDCRKPVYHLAFVSFQAQPTPIHRGIAFRIPHCFGEIDAWKKDFSNIPSADVAPVRHGRWIVGDSLPMHDIAGNLSWGNWYTCNQCEFKTYAIERHITQYNYCPNCGARMDCNK